jgi:hypothetical protein
VLSRVLCSRHQLAGDCSLCLPMAAPRLVCASSALLCSGSLCSLCSSIKRFLTGSDSGSKAPTAAAGLIDLIWVAWVPFMAIIITTAKASHQELQSYTLTTDAPLMSWGLAWLMTTAGWLGYQPWSVTGITHACFEHEVVTSNDKPRTVAHRYIIEASIDVS